MVCMGRSKEQLCIKKERSSLIALRNGGSLEYALEGWGM